MEKKQTPCDTARRQHEHSKVAAMTELSLGQVWVCGATDTTPPLMCIVGKLDEFPERGNGPRVVSIMVTPHPDAREAGWPNVSHMPVFEDAFQRSGLSLAKEGVELGQNFHNGYARWLAAFEEKKASIFSLSVSEAYAGIVSVLRDR